MTKNTILEISCRDCGAIPLSYRVHSSVWKQATPDYDELAKTSRCVRICLDCLAMRLGRPLTREDFPEVRCNAMLLFGYAMARVEDTCEYREEFD